MAEALTLRVIQGNDRGCIFDNLALTTPITIGREEGNVVQINDERVSRSHVKIQEKDGCLIITDLESTNGTRVNGQACHLKILRVGDTIAIGRTVLLLDKTNAGSSPAPISYENDSASEKQLSGTCPKSTSNFGENGSLPVLPRKLDTIQAAELRELLDHIHAGLQEIIEQGDVDEKQRRVAMDQLVWRQLLAIQSDISVWIRNIEDPQASET